VVAIVWNPSSESEQLLVSFLASGRKESSGMPIVALTGFVVFALLAFGLRGWIHHRRTGTTGFVGVTGAVASVEWFGGVLFAVAILAGFAAPVLQLAGLISPNAWMESGLSHAAGIGLFAVGLAATLWAQFAMGESWRIGVNTGERTQLIDGGPFRWVRNPIFTAMVTATAGLCLLVPNVAAFFALAALIAALEIQVRLVEEPYLAAAHGESYLRYARRTGRFIPGVGRLEIEGFPATTQPGR